jgi:hypothetical protein
VVKIQDHFVPTDFMVLDMGAEEEDTPIILGRPFLNTTDAIIYIKSGQIHFQFSEKRYAITLIVILIMSSPRSHETIEGDVDLAVKQTNR